MLYCLVAPGGITNTSYAAYDGGITGINGASNNNTSVSKLEGTSQAAPLVSGAVALVAQVFPWMNASQLATIILTTATNAGNPNAATGRGMLNVSAAIKGPGILETTFNANTGGYSSTFGNNISGTADLIKSGSGVLTLTGNNTYSGGTTVSGGTLFVLPGSSLGTGDVAITSGGILQDDGRTQGNIKVANGGILEPGNSPGYLYDPKNVTMYAGSMYKQDIAGTIQSGELTPVGASGYYSYMSLGGQFIINAGASLSPNLQNLFLTTEPGYGSNTNTLSVAAALDKLSAAQMANTASTAQSNLMYSTATQTSSSLAAYAQALSGEAYADTVAVIPQTSQRVQSAVMAHLSDTVMPVSSGNPNAAVYRSGNAVTPQNPTGILSSNVNMSPTVNLATDMTALPNNKVWGEVAYQYGNRSSDSNASGFNSNLYQAVFGADFYQESSVKAGAGFSLSTVNVSLSSGSGTVGQGSLFVYGKLLVMQDYVLDGMASVGSSSTDVTRSDPTSSTSLKARGIRGNDTLISAGISRLLETDTLTVTPYTRLTWQMVNQSPFDEGTQSVAALSVNGYSGNGLRC